MRSIMDVKDKIRFPMNPEMFIEIQEYLREGKLGSYEKKLFSMATEMMNLDYENGLEDCQPLPVIDLIKQSLAEAGQSDRFNEPVFNSICNTIATWCKIAFQYGRIVGGHDV